MMGDAAAATYKNIKRKELYVGKHVYKRESENED